MTKITSREGLFGTTIHYDENGHKVGETLPGFFGGTNYYDNDGHKIGHSEPGFFGGTKTVFDKKR